MDFKTIAGELKFKTSRSGGKGGQHVNKVSSRVQLFFCISKSKGLSDNEKEWLQQNINKRIAGNDTIQIIVQTGRSQIANKKEAIDKLEKLLLSKLKRPARRIKTKVAESEKQKRLHAKKLQGQRKEMRKRKFKPEEE